MLKRFMENYADDNFMELDYEKAKMLVQV